MPPRRNEPTASTVPIPTSSQALRPPTPPRAGLPARGAFRVAAIAIALGAALLAGTAPARAQWIVQGDQLRVSYGPSAWHFSSSTEHVRYNHLVSGELLTKRWAFWGAERSLAGLALFDNSFGQFTQYLYVGQEWDLATFAGGDLYVNATFGLLHGYKEPYENKIPFNRFGIAPVIIPTFGWRYGHASVFASVLGTNGFLFGASWAFDLGR